MALHLPVTDLALVEPALGEETLHHDADFVAWDDAFDAVRDTVNFGIRQLNHVGAGLPLLPEESLEELLVQPLAGDCAQIRQNADAARIAARAFGHWSGQVGLLSVQVAPIWGGEAGVALAGSVGGYAIAAGGADLLLAGGAAALELLATFSERIAVTVERALVRLGQVLRRLAVRVAEKLAGLAGAVKLLVDVVSDGLGALTDIIDDIRLVLDLVEEVRSLFDEVRTFVSDIEGRLRPLLGVPDLIRELA